MKDSSIHKIHLNKGQKTINWSSNKSILEATLSENINHTHACGGQGKCSTCRVSIVKGVENCNERNEAEQKIADKFNFPPEIRLACQTKISGDISIRRMVLDKFDEELISEQFTENSKTAIGRQQKMAIVFTDIVDYTSFAERFPPYDIVHVLNRYYRIMNTVIQNHNGIINNIIGDGILASFGFANDKHPVWSAVQATYKMKEELEAFNKYLGENFNTQFKIRAGVHYGNVIVGKFDIGVKNRIIMIGDSINYTSRIEAANKKFGTEILLSEEAYQEVKKEYPKHNLFKTNIKGKTGTYNLYEIKGVSNKL